MKHSEAVRTYLIVSMRLAEDGGMMFQSQLSRMATGAAIEAFCRRMGAFFLDKLEANRAALGDDAKVDSKIEGFLRAVQHSQFDEAYSMIARDSAGSPFRMCGVYLHGVGMFKKHFINVSKKGGRA